MKNRIKIAFSGLLCVCLLVAYALPVSSEPYYMDDMYMESTESRCSHANVLIKSLPNEYTQYSSAQHNWMTVQAYICEDCGNTLRTYRQDMGKEGHTWSYRDLGHEELIHNYEVICIKCYFNTKAFVPCNGAPHNTP